MTSIYQSNSFSTTPVEPARRPRPLSGSYLAHSPLSLIERAFLAADLVTGAKYLVDPTQTQGAALARVNRTYVHWAVKRSTWRWEIERGLLPLIPTTNGTTLAPTPESGIDDSGLVQIVRSVGVNRVLEAAIAAEAAE